MLHSKITRASQGRLLLVINRALQERGVNMTSQILKELGQKEPKKVIKSNVWKAKKLLENGRDYAINPETGYAWFVPEGY